MGVVDSLQREFNDTWTLEFPYVELKTTNIYDSFKDSQNNGKKFHLLQRTHIWNVLPSINEELSNFDAFRQKIKEDLKILQKINFDNDTCPVTTNDADVGYSTYICMWTWLQIIVKKTTTRTDQTTWKDCSYDVSTGQYQEDHEIAEIYMQYYNGRKWRSMVFLLKQKNNYCYYYYHYL